MTPERWQNINEIYHDALALDPDPRAAFLAEACGGDADLRDEVESLIASHDQAGNFIAEPALKVAARVLSEDPPASLVGKKFSHYEIDALLGVGGMGEVYLATDTQLDRKVAFKILNEKFGQDRSNLTRFVQEAKAASALNHPNILVIHEIGVSGEANYIVSEFVEGRTLREIVSEAPLRPAEVLDIAIQIAAALRAAHEAHLVHRDIKPENIIVRPDGYVKILDFGLAKLMERENTSALGFQDDTSRHNQTGKGVILGTVNYMSPEQAKGERVDERTDIFSLGVVMHEMLAGRTPFAGKTVSDTFANLINAEPEPLARSVANVPDALQKIISRMLRKPREQRYQTMREVVTDLKAVKERRFSPRVMRPRAFATFALAIALLGATAIGYRIVSSRNRISAANRQTSIAVLPSTPVNGSNHDEVYEIGIAETLIVQLNSMERLIVRPLSVTRRYAQTAQSALAAGREQKVDYVLASNYQVAGRNIRIAAQLLNVATGQVEATYKSEKDTANIFAMQDAIASDLGNLLSTRFATATTRPAVKRGTNSEQAYRLYLQGMYLNGKRNPADARKAVEVLGQAVHLDPNYAKAWAGKAYAHLTNFSNNPQVEYQRSTEAVNKALALDANLADAYVVVCANKMSYEWDFDGAGRACERAVTLDPNSSLAHLTYSRLLNGQGRFDAAIAEVKTAIDLEPSSLVSQRHYGACLYYARRYPEAVTQFKRVIAMDPGFGTTYNWLVFALEMQGNYSEAYEWWMKMKVLYKDTPDAMQAYRLAYATSGWQGLMVERARRCDLVSSRADYKGVYFQGAIEHAKAGHKDQAFAYLEQSYKKREIWMSLLKVEPGLDSLRSDPRFEDLIKRVGLS